MSRDSYEIQKLLDEALVECQRLQEENDRLKASPGIRESMFVSADARNPDSDPANRALKVDNQSSKQEKVDLFRSFFGARDDVFARRWENRRGASGYSPACRHEWNKPLCQKPAIRCSQCQNRDFLPLTDKAFLDHLEGRCNIGVYPLHPDDTCRFLVIDFDKESWQEDVIAVFNTCNIFHVPAIIERSRSGAGAHLWIFFNESVIAGLARKLGSGLLTHTAEHHHLHLDSYDRLFPNQDTMPKGGFGNLIALPLQHDARLDGNSLFVNENFEPMPDQWKSLAGTTRLPAKDLEVLVEQLSSGSGIVGIRVFESDFEEEPWRLPPSKLIPDQPIAESLPQKICIVSSNLVFVDKSGLPNVLINRLIRLAAFQNPEFYRAQAMRLSTFGKPRIISCAEDFPKHIGLPRGCVEDVKALLTSSNVKFEVEDKRFAGVAISADFQGKLAARQQEAATALLAHDIGVLSAPTAFGKTVLGAWLIAKRKTNTLILVHRRQLMDQWRERLAAFLDIPINTIGQIGGGKNKPMGIIDVALMQSLNRKGQVKDIVADYGQLIVDECHHLPAFSFEKVLKEVKAQYVVGLTATPIRKDGHHPIITMQCGPIRWQMSAPKQADERPFQHFVIPRATKFKLKSEESDPGIQEIYFQLVSDNNRNSLILEDIRSVVRAGRSPLVLTERREHLAFFASELEKDFCNVIILQGGMGTKQRRKITEHLSGIDDSEERIIVATGRYAGEGFDDARLDTLFLTMPISWRGTLQQYAGRLHRLHDSKQVVQIYDYVDEQVPVLVKMYKKRLKGYAAMGYTIKCGWAGVKGGLPDRR